MLLTVIVLALSEWLLFFSLTAVVNTEYTDLLATEQILIFLAQRGFPKSEGFNISFLGTQNTSFLLCIMSPYVACLALPVFPALFHERHEFRK
jgi:hypothetical protein